MKKHNIAQISFLIACGSALQLAEAFIPFPVPIPGVKTGLANITTLLGLVLFGPGVGFEVAVFRPVITSLTNGTFLSPGLVLSFCGSVTSFAVIALAYYWLFPHAAILALAPVLAVAAVIGGYLDRSDRTLETLPGTCLDTVAPAAVQVLR